MTSASTTRAYVLAIAGGAILWLLAAAAGGRIEAWDSPLYWSVAYPLGVVLAGILGYAFPKRAWRWALAVTAAGFSLLRSD
jgi:hypothetical protein